MTLIREASETVYTPDQYMPTHRDRWSKLGLILSGSFHEQSASSEAMVGVGDLIIKGQNHWHATRIGCQSVRVFSVRIPELVAEKSNGYALHQDDWGGLKQVLELYSAWKLGKPKLFRMRYQRMMRFFASTRPQTKQAPEWLLQTRDRLLASHEVQVKELAAEAGCHPVHLARCFRATFHCSIREFRQLLRLKSVLVSLPKKDNLAQVAQDAGFYDQSHMNHSFRNQFGVSPGLWRKANT